MCCSIRVQIQGAYIHAVLVAKKGKKIERTRVDIMCI